jgi:hypothetical protein
MMIRAEWIALLALAACSPSPTAPDEVLSVATSLSAEPDPRFERALEPRQITFPLITDRTRASRSNGGTSPAT